MPNAMPNTGDAIDPTGEATTNAWSGYGLTLTVTKSDQLRASVRLVGDLDLASAPVMQAALEHELARGRRYVRLDLSGLAFADSMGLAALVDLHWAFLHKRGTLILVNAGRRVRRLFDITGAERTLLVAADPPPATIAPVA